MEKVRIAATDHSRLPILADVLGRAFLHDPMIRWPMTQVPDMQPRIARFFAAIYRPYMETGTMWEAGDGAGFAHWVPPGGAEAALATPDSMKEALLPLTDDDGARYDILWAWIEERVPEDVWYLDSIGVDPARQGEGIGTALMRFGIDRASDLGTGCFLETGVPGNVGYYERFGFRVVDEGEAAKGCPHIWFMRTG